MFARRVSGPFFASLLFVACVLAGPPDRNSGIPYLPAMLSDAAPPRHPIRLQLVEPIGIPAQDRALLARLRRRPVYLEAIGKPLDQALTILRDQTGVNILLDRVALEEEAITVDIPVSARYDGTPLERALHDILSHSNLTYTVRSGVVWVTTPQAATRENVTRIYPVADLVWLPSDRRQGEIDSQSLLDLITSGIAPETWTTVGGPGDVRFWSGNLSLIVAAAPDVQDLVANLLGALRQAGAEPGERAAGFLPVPAAGLPHERKAERRVLGADAMGAEVARLLKNRAGSLHLRDAPLETAVSGVARAAGILIELDGPALKKEGIQGDTPVSIDAWDIALSDLLELVLRPLSLTWVVRSGHVVVTSRGQAGNELVTCSYPIADLVTVVPGREPSAVLAEELMDVIRAVAVPESWAQVGGPAEMRYFRPSRCLVVSQTRRGHDEVAEILAMAQEASERLSLLAHAAGLPSLDVLLPEIEEHAAAAVGFEPLAAVHIRVRYDGERRGWDEWVDPDRIQAVHARDREYGIGDRVRVRWNGIALPATVLDIQEDRD